jgi:hypothetical protein
MTTVISGSSPSITFSDSTTQTTAFTSTPSITTITTSSDASISGLTVGKGGGADIYTTAVGYQALLNGTNPIYSSAFGYQAGKGITTGQANTAIGREVMNTGTVTGASNTGIGNYALHVLSTGSNNFAGGESSLLANTTGSSNTAIGMQSLNANTTASNNTAVGYQAGYSNTTGIELTAIGYQAGYGNTTGSSNTSFGYASLKTNTTGSSNHAFGSGALNGNTTGNDNIGIGLNALVVNTTGSNNVGIGRMALQANTTASNNTAVGYQAGYTNATNTDNTLLGYRAGYTLNSGGNLAVGSDSLSSCTSGNLNTIVGYSAGNAITTGSKNTILGRYTGNQGGLDIRTASNYIVLSDGDGNPRGIFDNSGNLLINVTAGFSSGKICVAYDGTTNNGMVLKTTNATLNSNFLGFYNSAGNNCGVVSQNGTTTVAYTTSSDYRLKENIVPMTGALATVAQLKPVTYKWKSDGSDGQGFIAHELQAIVPDCVVGEKDALDADGNPKYQGIDTSFLVATLTAAIQELKAEFDAQAAEIAELKAKVGI